MKRFLTVIITLIILIFAYQNCSQSLPEGYQSLGSGDQVDFIWTDSGFFSQCSASCNGTQEKQFVCMSLKSNTVVGDRYCDLADRPVITRSCGSQNTCGDYYWGLQAGTCSETCGGGTRTDTYVCKNSNGNNVAASNCSGFQRPEDVTQSCNTHACTDFAWDSSASWSTCSATCGGGTQTRDVFCKDLTDNSEVGDSNCSGTKPQTSRSCNTQACPTADYTTKQVYWAYSSTNKDHYFSNSANATRSTYGSMNPIFKLYKNNASNRVALFNCRSADGKKNYVRKSCVNQETKAPSTALGFVDNTKSSTSGQALYVCLHPTNSNQFVAINTSHCTDHDYVVQAIMGYVKSDANPGNNYIPPTGPQVNIYYYEHSLEFSLGGPATKFYSNFLARGNNYFTRSLFVDDPSYPYFSDYDQGPKELVAKTYSNKSSGMVRLYQCASSEYQNNRIHNKFGYTLFTDNLSECNNGYKFPGQTDKTNLHAETSDLHFLGYIYKQKSVLADATKALIRCRKSNVSGSEYVIRLKVKKVSDPSDSNACGSGWSRDRIIGYTKN